MRETKRARKARELPSGKSGKSSARLQRSVGVEADDTEVHGARHGSKERRMSALPLAETERPSSLGDIEIESRRGNGKASR